MGDKSYYKILGVEGNCSQKELKKAFKTLILQYHPDKNPNGEDKFKEIAKAYKVLSDPEMRRIYDVGGYGVLEMTFEEFFANFNWNDELADILDQANYKERRKRGSDVVNSLNLTLRDLYTGTVIHETVMKTIICNSCKGPGIYSCNTCKGSKVMTVPKTFTIHIKKGMLNGQEIYRIGEGDEDVDFYPGDRIFRICQVEDPLFERNANDLIQKVKLPYTIAKFGGDFTVKTINGKNLNVGIKSGTTDGSMKTIPDNGFCDYFIPEKRGNLLLQFEVPTVPSSAASSRPQRSIPLLFLYCFFWIATFLLKTSFCFVVSYTLWMYRHCIASKKLKNKYK